MIDEIKIELVTPKNGLVAFASFTYMKSIRCASVAIYTRPDGGFRLVYPNKRIYNQEINVFYPINHDVGKAIEEKVAKKCEEVVKEAHDRHRFTSVRYRRS